MPVLGRLKSHAQDETGLRLGGDEYRAAVAGGTRNCGAPQCAGTWVPPWRSRTRPVFEQQWGCGAKCMETMVRAAVRRESGDGVRAGGGKPHRHRVPLGLVLLAQGWITHPQLQRALEAQKASGQGRIGDWLVQGGGLEEEQVTRGLGVQWNCPVLALEGFSPKDMALVMPKRFVAEFGVVPLRVAGRSRLYVAFADRLDPVTSLGVEQMSGLAVENGLLGGTEFAAARAGVLEADGVPVTMASAGDVDALTAAVTKMLAQKQPVASRLVRVHQYYWLRMWQESGSFSGVGALPAGPGEVEDCLFTVA